MSRPKIIVILLLGMSRPVMYSWILPIRNEARSLPQLIDEIRQAMSGKRCQIVAVDDASSDRTLAVLKDLRRKLADIKIIHFSFPRGKWAALRCGIQQARGKVLITSDADLQDDPKGVSKLIEKLGQGFDLVSGWRTSRQDLWYKVAISRLGNAVISIVTHHCFHDLNSPFKVFRRRVVLDLPLEGSLFRFSLLFAECMEYKIAEVPIAHRSRRFGKSKFGPIKYIRILFDLFLVLLLFSGSGRLYREQK